ncbi:MAG: hypothetical protein JNK72_04990 [Myxococcales bacterium]|nr:hypothetical protein [Myxococcales bacterium]
MKWPGLWMALALAVGCGDTEGDTAGQFVAFTDHFRPFRNWTRLDVGSEPLEGHPPGPRFVYINQPNPPAGGDYPVGTIIVKSVEPSANFSDWELFAMVKRGGSYNVNGAVGWEYFILGMSTAGVPVILSRGLNPTDLHGYGGGGATTQTQGCNGCHGTAAGTSFDHILSLAIRPGATRP